MNRFGACVALIFVSLSFKSDGAPVFYTVDPNTAGSAGGQTISIYGMGFDFAGQMQVLFDGQPATSVTARPLTGYDDELELIQCILPPGEVGPADITVVNPDGSSYTSGGKFSYVQSPPNSTCDGAIAVSSGDTVEGSNTLGGLVSPSCGAAGLGVWYSYEAEADGYLQLSLCEGTSIDSVVSVYHACSGNEIGCDDDGCALYRSVLRDIPVEAGITYFIAVSGSGSSRGNFSLRVDSALAGAPVITSIEPDNGLTTGGEEVIITGHNFDLEGETQVLFEGVAASDVQVAAGPDGLQLTCTTPPGTKGLADLKVVNPDGAEFTAQDLYRYRLGTDVTITSVTPDNESVTGGAVIQIHGNNIRSSSGYQVKIGDAWATEVRGDGYVVRATTPPNAAGVYDVTLIDPNGNWAVLKDAFRYVEGNIPRVDGAYPWESRYQGGDEILIIGDHFDAIEDIGVYFDGIPALDVEAREESDGDVIFCRTPPHAVGTVQLTVVNAGGGSDSIDFEYVIPAPDVDYFAPSIASVNGGDIMRIVGSGFLNTDEVFLQVSHLNPEIISITDTTVTFIAPPHEPGPVNAFINNGSASSRFYYDAYEYVVPPQNLNCDTAMELSDGSTTSNTSGACIPECEGATCVCTEPDSLWFRYTARAFGLLQVVATNGTLQLWNGCDGDVIAEQLCAGAACDPLTYAVEAGDSYFIAYHPAPESIPGKFVMTAEVEVVPLTTENLQEILGEFDVVDTDENGELSVEEIAAFRGSFSDLMLSELDRDESGTVSRTEVVISTAPGELHSADRSGDSEVSLQELLRVVQLFNLQGYHCDEESPDGFGAGPDEGRRGCIRHATDFQFDWRISLGELLRLIQFFNVGGYSYCPELLTPDGYCANGAVV